MGNYCGNNELLWLIIIGLVLFCCFGNNFDNRCCCGNNSNSCSCTNF